MGNKIILDEEILRKKYIDENLSQKDVAKFFGCSTDTIIRNLKDYGIQSHKNIMWMQNDLIELTKEDNEILNGALLGDGNLTIHKNGRNPYFSYISKSLQHVQFVSKNFIKFSSGNINDYTYYDKRTNKEYKNYKFKTYSNIGFLDQYYAWYINNKKHIPANLVLSPITCLIWYLGDGGICNSKKSNAQEIKLSTHCFEKEEIENILLPQLIDFDARIRKSGIEKSSNREQYAIYIPHNKMSSFLSFIGNCPFQDYKYKWEVKPCKKVLYKQYYDDWEKMYLNGINTQIAKQYGADNTTVLYHLIKNGIYKYKNKSNNEEVVYYEE